MLSKIKNQVVKYVSSHKKGLVIALVAVFVGSMLLRGVMQYPRLSEQKREISDLNAQIEYENERRKEVEDLKGKVNSDEYIKKIATEKLGLIPNNAKVFVDVSGEQQ